MGKENNILTSMTNNKPRLNKPPSHKVHI